jgi:hypothetical protein
MPAAGRQSDSVAAARRPGRFSPWIRQQDFEFTYVKTGRTRVLGPYKRERIRVVTAARRVTIAQ